MCRQLESLAVTAGSLKVLSERFKQDKRLKK